MEDDDAVIARLSAKLSKKELEEYDELIGGEEEKKWVPPHRRREKDIGQLATGLLNRLSDATLEASATEAIRWYDTKSPSAVNTALITQIKELALKTKRSDDSLLLTYAAFVAAVDVGGKRRLGRGLLKSLGELNERSAMLAARLCEIGLFTGSLALSIAEALRNDVGVAVLQICYERVQRDDRERFERFRILGDSPRERHAAKCLEEIRLVKNDRAARLRKVVRAFGDLVPIEAEWKKKKKKKKKSAEKEEKKKRKLVLPLDGLARAQRINTPAKRDIFVKLMSCGDPEEALLIKGDERDIASVAVNCCLAEKSYNLFYAAFLEKWLKEKKKSAPFAVKLAVWDALKSLDSPRKANNLAKLCSKVLARPAVVGVSDIFKHVDPKTALTDTNTHCFATLLLRDLLGDSPPPDFSACLRIAAPSARAADSTAAGLLAFISAKLTPPHDCQDIPGFDRRKAQLYHAILGAS